MALMNNHLLKCYREWTGNNLSRIIKYVNIIPLFNFFGLQCLIPLFVWCVERKKKRAVKMMVIVVLLFTVCWAPFHTVHMLYEYSKVYPRAGPIFRFFTFFTTVVKSACLNCL